MQELTRLVSQLPAHAPAMAVLDWSTLVRCEPRLAKLKLEAKAAFAEHDDDDRVYVALKRRLNQLVGWSVRNELLGSSMAYDIAHQEVLGAW